MDSRSIGVGWPPLGGDSEKVFRTRPPLQVDQLVIANIRGYVRSNASGGRSGHLQDLVVPDPGFFE
jgi:hypothetical protein